MTAYKFVKKDSDQDKKKMISARVDTELMKAFKRASAEAKNNGYKLTFSGVIESALVEAIGECEKISGKKFLMKGGEHHSID